MGVQGCDQLEQLFGDVVRGDGVPGGGGGVPGGGGGGGGGGSRFREGTLVPGGVEGEVNEIVCGHLSDVGVEVDQSLEG